MLAIIKPSFGLHTLQLKKKIVEVLSSGFHAVKDDEMLGNVPDSPLQKRIELAKKHKGYMPVLNFDNPEHYRKYLAGGDISMILINASTVGFPALREIKKR